MIMGTNENINNEKINYKFKDFVEKCVVGEVSLLTSDEKLFSINYQSINNLACTRDFIKKIKPLFDKVNDDARKYNKNQQSEKKKIWGIGDIFNENVFESELFQKDLKDLKEYRPNIVKILLHCNWLMYLCSDRQHKQNTTYYKEDIDDFFKVDTKWSIGPTFSGTSLDAMLFIVELVLEAKKVVKNITDNTVERTVAEIEKLCIDVAWKNNLKWDDNDKNTVSSDAIVNILLYLCDSEHYLPIPAQDKKRLISEKLSGLCKNENTEELKDMAVIDRNLYNIRESIRGIHKQNAEKEYEKMAKLQNPFWQPSIRPFWDESAENLNNEKLSYETLLDYKKAMILYGPPGTSKSYQARRIAESMIAKALRKQKSFVDCINQLQTTPDSHIHILQMHPNYTYDDFIVGKSIEGTNIVVKPGKMLQIIAGIKSDDNLPHFVILDEINRVDISRVFGELFTAMESSYREKGVELSVDVNRIPEDSRKNLTIDKNTNKLFLKVPENMYFIGTMNMIDFSLEQVDFALRRRFLWKLSTYDPKRLEEIISEKVAEKIKNLQEEKAKNEKEEIALWNNRPDNYIECCTALNNEIEWESNLGKNYLIGHTFFAEIVDIFERVKDWGKAKNILWQVSILPTLDAYCGTMDSEMQKRFVCDCKDAFLPELKDNKKKDNPKQSQDSEITNGQ